MAIQKYKIDILNYTTNGSVRSDCADITFYNNGSNPIVLNNSIIISPGNSLNLSANYNELDITVYQYYFILNTPAQFNKLVVFRKIYV